LIASKQASERATYLLFKLDVEKARSQFVWFIHTRPKALFKKNIATMTTMKKEGNEMNPTQQQQQRRRGQHQRRRSLSTGPQNRLQEKTRMDPAQNMSTSTHAPATDFLESVKQMFAPCGGVVDVATFILGNCRGATRSSTVAGDGGDILRCGGGGAHATSDDIVFKLRERGAAAFSSTQRRQGETLEFPANGGFDDDVSAISAHTLEEMERRRLAAAVASAATASSAFASDSSAALSQKMNGPSIYPQQHHHGQNLPLIHTLSPPPSRYGKMGGIKNLSTTWKQKSSAFRAWNGKATPPEQPATPVLSSKKTQSALSSSQLPTPYFPAGQSDDMSIGVSTSGSASTNDGDRPEGEPLAAVVTPEATGKRKKGLFSINSLREG
jgi:hypothetical protein